MAETYDRYDSEGGGFMMGLIAGTVLGAGLGMLLAPKSGSDLRGVIGEQARNLSSRASEQYRRASEQATNWAERGRDMMNQAKDAVSRGVDEARSYPDSSSGGSYPGGSSGTSYGSGSQSGSTPGSTPYGGGSGSDYGRS